MKKESIMINRAALLAISLFPPCMHIHTANACAQDTTPLLRLEIQKKEPRKGHKRIPVYTVGQHAVCITPFKQKECLYRLVIVVTPQQKKCEAPDLDMTPMNFENQPSLRIEKLFAPAQIVYILGDDGQKIPIGRVMHETQLLYPLRHGRCQPPAPPYGPL